MDTRIVKIEGSYATAADKSSFRIAIEAVLNEPGQVQAMLEAGLLSTLYRGGNSILDKAFAPRDKDQKPVMKDFKRASVPFSVENGEKIRELLAKFFTTAEGEKLALAAGVTITVSEKLPGEEDTTGGIKTYVKAAEAWLVGKSQEQIDAAAERLDEKFPDLLPGGIKYNDGKIDVESFAVYLKANAEKAKADAMAAAFEV